MTLHDLDGWWYVWVALSLGLLLGVMVWLGSLYAAAGRLW